MEDAYVDEFTDEERAILEGETKVEETVTETKPEGTGPQATETTAQETEKPAGTSTETEAKEPEALSEEEKQEAEASGLRLETDEKGRQYLLDDDGSKIPVTRFKAVYKQAQEGMAAKEKYDLLNRLGAEEFYKLYPDEAPQGYKPPERKASAPITEGFDVLNIAVTGGPYDGMSLRDVMKVDPDSGTAMLNTWKDQQNAAIREQESKAEASIREQERDAYQFGMSLAKELWGIDDANKLTADHNRRILLIGQEVIEWQRKEGLMALPFARAYQLMTHEDRITKAREEGAKKALEVLQKKGPASINTGDGGEVKATGWEAVEKMTEAQIESHIDKMSDSEMAKFLKEAPASVKSKYPSMPWK